MARAFGFGYTLSYAYMRAHTRACNARVYKYNPHARARCRTHRGSIRAQMKRSCMQALTRVVSP
eukprot:3764148-Alexandrium_andersonii.AAC.1